eukprot:6459924-Amphidinium_carterae.1
MQASFLKRIREHQSVVIPGPEWLVRLELVPVQRSAGMTTHRYSSIQSKCQQIATHVFHSNVILQSPFAD